MVRNIVRSVTFILFLLQAGFVVAETMSDSRLNILIAITDDPSWKHTSVQGSPFVSTPNDDPESLNDLAGDPDHAEIFTEFQKQLIDTLTETGDPRVSGYGHIWEDFPRVKGQMRYFPETN